MKNITVEVSSNYDVIIENNLLDHIEEYLDSKRKYFIVTDNLVPYEYIEKLLKKINASVYVIDGNGEEIKTLETISGILDCLVNIQAPKDICIVAVGGGVVGDISAFVSSIYKRGVSFINIPTTLLSMVDSSIGGKNGVNMNGYKNIVGTIYQPNLVLIDPTVLKTLKERHFNNGMAEVIKMAAISDKKFFEELININVFDSLEEIIYKSLMIKKKFVEADEFDNGIRMALNFGHTRGHAIEMMDKDIYHGEAVAYGMNKIIKDDKMKEILRKFNLYNETNYDKETILNIIKNDKKIKGNKLNFVVVNEIGSYEIKQITLEELEREYL